MMDLNQFTQYFDNPKVSIFDISKSNDFPLYIGQFVPARWDILSFGNSTKGNSGHKMRLSPLLAPNFSNLRLQEHTGVAPLRVLMKDYEETFNFAKNREGASLPHLTGSEYHNLLYTVLLSGQNIVGTLLDFLGYPVYADVYKAMRADISKGNIYLRNSNDSTQIRDIFFIPSTVSQFEHYQTAYGQVHYRDSTIFFDSQAAYFFPDSFYKFVYDSSMYSGKPYSLFLSDYPNPTLENFVEVSDYETVDSLTNAYFNYLFGIVLQNYLNGRRFPNTLTYSTLPLRAFWRIYYDWCTNGNFTDRDTLLEDRVYNFEDTLLSYLNDGDDGADGVVDLINVPSRLWSFDAFTSLLPSAAIDNAIEIPSNSTVLDLAKLTALQKLALRLSYSSRYRDVVWNVFKIAPSDARLQQSTIISRTNHDVGIGEVLQTSETSVSSVLGSFSGRGYSSGRSKGYHIFAEEPCVVIDFVSLMPKASYNDALHPLIHVDDILDFPIPDMDVLGNQPIRSEFLSGNPEDFDVVLGYGRQYWNWLCQYGTVHGEFKTTLDYWQLTRSFNETPVINDDFLRISPADDFDKIFSVPNAPHALFSVYYNVKVSRHVHRSVRIAI